MIKELTIKEILNGEIRVIEKKLTLSLRVSKRILDIVISSLAIIISLPILIIAMIIIKIDSPGSPIFRQIRIGKGGKPFVIYKLRGMYIDAKTRFPELYDYSKKSGLDFYFHQHDDPRITRVGKILRKTSIDEFPNFFNVLKGDMTIVGPRPEIPEILPLYGEYVYKYLSIKPGITCISKAFKRDALNKQSILEQDLEYIDTINLKLDIKIIWYTFVSVILRKNIYI